MLSSASANTVYSESTSIIDTVLRQENQGEPDSFEYRNYTRINAKGLIEVCLKSSRVILTEGVTRRTIDGGMGTSKKSPCQWESISAAFLRVYPENEFISYGYSLIGSNKIRLIASKSNLFLVGS